MADTRGLFGLGTSRNVARSFSCVGTETRLRSCSYTSVSISSGTSYQLPWYSPAGVICQGNTSAPTECDRGDVRLVNGSKRTEGRVEICSSGYWAIACYGSWPYRWDISKTRLICKRLGFSMEC